MSRLGNDTKMRILAIEYMILHQSPISTQKIINMLAKEYNISVERKTVYDDINTLTYFYPIVFCKKDKLNVWMLSGMEENDEGKNEI